MNIIINDYSSNGIITSRDTAFKIRKIFENLLIEKNNINIILDFKGVSLVTQSSIDELIGVFITNENNLDIIKNFSFINCNEKIKSVIKFVIIDRVSRITKKAI